MANELTRTERETSWREQGRGGHRERACGRARAGAPFRGAFPGRVHWAHCSARTR